MMTNMRSGSMSSDVNIGIWLSPKDKYSEKKRLTIILIIGIVKFGDSFKVNKKIISISI